MLGRLFRRAEKRAVPAPARPQQTVSEAALSELSPTMMQREAWAWPEPALMRETLVAATESGRIWRDVPGGHKWLSYFEAYDSLFAPYRGTAPNVLEIGVDRGGSLVLWERFFGKGARITGIDINPDCARFERAADNVRVRIGSQADPAFLAAVARELGPFDIIIDDGSHVVSHQIASFNALFDAGLKPGGIYMVEDLETSYWGHRSGQIDRPCTFMDFARAVLDVMHQPYTEQDYPAFPIETTPGRTLNAPRLARLVSQIRFFDSIAAFYRADRIPPVVEYLPGD